MINNPEIKTDPIQHGADTGKKLLRYVQRFNWLLLTFLMVGSWILTSEVFALSILIGGLLANVSFFLLRRDLERFLDNYSKAGMNWGAVKKLEKIKFFLHFYGRLMVLALVLYFLVTKVSIDVIGLIIGLSTIMLSVIIVVLSKGSALLSVQGVEGA